MIRFKKIKNNYNEHIEELIENFKEDKDILALYVFGSYAKGNVKPLSDIDFAVVLNNTFPKEKYSKKRINLLNKAVEILKTEEIDLIILNQVSPFLGFQVIKGDRILFCRDNLKLVNMRVNILNKYFDFMPVINEYNKYLHLRIKEGKFGYGH